MRIGIAADHAGYSLKQQLVSYLGGSGYFVQDFGPKTDDSVDYPDYAVKAIEPFVRGEFDRIVLVCGTGIGMSIIANRFQEVRAALVHNVLTAKSSRQHNDANVLVLGGRVLNWELAKEILDTWLQTEFEGGRHLTRLRKIGQLLEKDK